MINLSRIVKSKKFSQSVSAIVVYSSINEFGESYTREDEITFEAAIFPMDVKYTQREDGGNYEGGIVAYTTDTNIGTTVKKLPDYILYKDTKFKVMNIEDYLDYGFIGLVCGLTNRDGIQREEW
jgi:hypothetical protein